MNFKSYLYRGYTIVVGPSGFAIIHKGEFAGPPATPIVDTADHVTEASKKIDQLIMKGEQS